MKFANIDEAILEAAKISGKPKTAPNKKGKKVPVVPAKKSSKPKKAEAPRGKKAPIPAPKKEAPVAQKPTTKAPDAPTKPAASTTPEPAKADEPKRLIPKPEPQKTPDEPKRLIPKAEPAPAAKSEPAPSRERSKFAPRWLTANRGIGDRLKDAFNSFKQSAGKNLGTAGASWQSVFHEAQQLMKEYQLIESMLQEQALYEGLTGNQDRLDVAPPFGDLTAADFEELRDRKSAIREALAAQMVREELYFHRTNLAELNTNQRVALAETVKSQCDEMFTRLMSEGMGEDEEDSNTLEEGTEERDAIVKALRAALNARGGKASVGTVKDLQQQLAQLNRRVKQPEDGVTEQFTLEEWMGALQEAGYDTAEIDENLRKFAAGAAMMAGLGLGGATDAGAQSTTPPPVPNDSVSTTIARDLNRVGPAQTQNRMNLTGRKITPHPTAGTGVQSVTPGPGGTYVVTTDYREQKPKRNMEEQFTLEEWMGMLSEAGYELEEVSQADIMGGWQGIAPKAPGANPHTEMGLAAQGNAEPTTGEEEMEEQFTLEEWMGMMTEAGFNLNELSPDEIEAQKNSPEARLKASWRSGRAEAPSGATGPYFRASDGSVQPVSRTVGAVDRKQQRGVTKTQNREAELRRADAERTGVVSPPSQASLKSRLQATGVKGYNRPNIDASATDKQDMDRQISTTLAQPRLKRPIAPKGFDDSGVPVAAESINENTVSRFQQLAGIKPAE